VTFLVGRAVTFARRHAAVSKVKRSPTHERLCSCCLWRNHLHLRMNQGLIRPTTPSPHSPLPSRRTSYPPPSTPLHSRRPVQSKVSVNSWICCSASSSSMTVALLSWVDIVRERLNGWKRSLRRRLESETSRLCEVQKVLHVTGPCFKFFGVLLFSVIMILFRCFNLFVVRSTFVFF